MNNHHPTDHPDALLDRGLAELLGGETPPDLSDRILAVANKSLSLANRPPQSAKTSWWRWAGYAVAASLLVGGGVVLLSPAINSSGLTRRNRDLALAERSLERYERLYRSSKSVDTGSTIDAKKQSRELMMTVTPHIIIEEGEEEERLGIPTEEQSERPGIAGEQGQEGAGEQSESQSQPFAPSSNMGLKGLINDAYAVEGVGHAQAGTPIALPDVLHQQGEKLFRRSASETQSQHYYSDVDVELARQNRGEELRGRSQRFRIDARPGIQAGDHFAVTRTTPTEAETFSFSLGFERNTPPSRDQYTPIHENPFITADGPDAVSTFSIDVDTASYANVRQFLESGRLPPADAVRIEELVNYFDYDYAGPTDDKPFAAHMEVAACPWDKDHRLARIAIKGKEIARDERPQSNLVFLVDVSGSMNDPNKLPLLVEGMKMLTRELGENDRVAIVVYASSEGLALESTRGDEQETILAALDQLRAGGSTAGGAGINLAYQVALDNFIEGGTNRVILCTDGDFNVGVTDTAQLEQLAVEKAKTGVFLTVLGFGRGNLNDAMMEGISGKGNGNYHYVDNLTEARKVLVEEMAGTLVTIAKDVKIQVEFNPAQVAGYRLIGYENRLLRTEDFNDDKKDAGEIGAGHTVTALYEIIPAGQEVTPPSVDPLKYQKPLAGLAEETTKSAKPQATSDELLTLKLRYKLPDATKSTKLEFPITDKVASFADATDDFQFAAAVASFGMLLRHSQYQGETSFDAVQEIAQASLGSDPHNYRSEFLELVRIAKELTGVQTDVRSKTEGP